MVILVEFRVLVGDSNLGSKMEKKKKERLLKEEKNAANEVS